jgi:mono/diheme cytochrome c family protein
MGNRTVIELLLGSFFSVGIGILLLLGWPHQEDNMARLERMATASEIARGAELFEANCRSCHGVNGEGVGELGPALNDRAFFQDRLAVIGWEGTLAEYVEATIMLGRIAATRQLYVGDGVVAMTAWGQAYGGPLRPDEIRALTSFVRNWDRTALGQVSLQPLVPPTPSAEDLAAGAGTGRKIFETKGCADCHIVSGISHGQGGPDLSGVATRSETRRSGYTAEAYLRESFLVPNAYRIEGYPPDVVCGGVLSQSQLDDLVAFLLSLR